MSETWRDQLNATRWCEHMKPGTILQVDRVPIVPVLFCPFCGAKRPEKPKTLREKMRHAFAGHDNHFENDFFDDRWKLAAQAAYEHFCEVLEETTLECFGASAQAAVKSKIKERMRESL